MLFVSLFVLVFLLLIGVAFGDSVGVADVVVV